MKKRIIYLVVLFAGMLTHSCTDDFFDTIPGDRLTLEQTFKSASLSESYLANVYTYVPDEFSQRFVSGTAGPWTGGSSEAEYVWGFVESQKINNGSLDPSASLVSKNWVEFYKGINKASTFIQLIDGCKEMPIETRIRRKAEARALRAYYYLNLFKTYGPIVLLGEEPISSDASFDEVQLPRNSVEECVSYISLELLKASYDLPDKSPDSEYGRITKPMVLAFRSQLFLFAASPLFNGNTDYADMKKSNGSQIFPQTYNAALWDSARISAKLFLDKYVPTYYTLYKVGTDGKVFTGISGQKYDPYISYRETVRAQEIESNPEMIFYRIQAGVSGFQYELTPFHSGAPSNEYKGSGGKSVTQEMVDLYFTNKGVGIDQDPDYKVTGMSNKAYNDPFLTSRTFAPVNTFNQWVSREPRFYADVTFNNSVWLKTDPQKIVTTTYFSGNSGKSVGGNDYPVTGYIVRKGAPLGNWNIGGRACILTRLGEIYLNYAEAANECGEYAEAIKYVNLIRERAGIPEYGAGTDNNGFERIAYPVNKDEIRNRIRRERALELAFENIRYFDVRRWKVADMAVGDGWVYPISHLGGEGGDYYGLNVSQDPPTKFFQKVVFEKRVFEKKHYFFPIPQNEINKNSRLVQTSGWETKEVSN